MRHRKHTFKIGRSGAHRKALLANQVCSLITEGKIKTTVTKAKETRRIADKMVTLGKKGELHHRRLAISKLRDETAVAQLFADIAPKFSNRDGGYTRIIRVGTRKGDAADLCILQWVEAENSPKPSKKKAKAKKEESKVEAKEEAVVEDQADEKKTEAKEEAAPEAEAKEEPKAETEEKKEEAKEEKVEEKAEAKKEEPKEEKKEEPAGSEAEADKKAEK